MSIDVVLLRLDAAARAVAESPWAVQALVALGTVCGLVLWLSGARLLRPMTIVLGALAGACLGFVIGPLFGGPSEEGGRSVAGAYGLLIGLPAGALGGVVLYKSATAVALGLALAAAAPLCAAGLLSLHVLPTGELMAAAPAREGSLTSLVSFGDEALTDTLSAQLPPSLPLDAATFAVPDQFQPAAERAREAFEHTTEAIESRLEGVPAQHRAVLVLSSLGGLAVGIVLGLMAPSWAAGACAAMLGSALWLGGGVWLSGSLGAPWVRAGGMLDRTPMQWLAVWGSAAVAGLLFQGFWAWRRRSRPGAA